MIQKEARKLDREAWLLITINGLFAIANALSNTFVNIYLWKMNHDLITISWFQFSSYIGMLIATLFAGWLTKKLDRVINIRLGVGILSIFYTTVLFLGTTAIQYVWILGALLGIGSGFFWIAFSVLYFEITERPNRDRFNGVNGLFGALAGMISPLISGFVISRIDHGLFGYQMIFTVSLVLFLIAVAVSFAFRPRLLQGDYYLFEVAKGLKHRDSKWYWVCAAMFLQGIREGVLVYLVGLLLFMVVQKEMILGGFLTATSFVALIANYIISRMITEKSREMSMTVGTVMLGVVILPFFFYPNIWTIFILGIGVAFFYPFYYGPLTSTIFDVLGENEHNVAWRVEHVAIKDTVLYLGRIVTVFLFIGWIHFSVALNHMRWYLLAVAFVQLPVILFARRFRSKFDRM
ncbi:MFS transporter, YQGE family, putative transporter [Seinonella peptonophila]|uniref:MFS transporter, YQGE family, putative transporter n=1 Tax=Seinonella peptonophila TaxID=112248 RepID=A0A1M4WC64_9BACL|nr:MFS transporter [Seinonella peptonophila]SHE78824.1 MFS transporter, YQGE family, putative transporter [Seinonella peptonophila]